MCRRLKFHNGVFKAKNVFRCNRISKQLWPHFEHWALENSQKSGASNAIGILNAPKCCNNTIKLMLTIIKFI